MAIHSERRVLITGSNGFTGAYMRQELECCGFQVFGIDTAVSHPDEVKCDLLDLPELTRIITDIKPNYVIHLAGIADVQFHDQVEIYRINIFATLNLLQAICDAEINPKKILIASSANVYGNRVNSIISEDTIPCPNNHYANSKLAMEFMVRNWFDKLPIIITRPFNYTGVGQSTNFVIPKIVEHFQQGKKEILLGNTNIIRDFSDVRNVVEAYYALLISRSSSQIYNICSGIGFSLDQVIEYLETLAGYKIILSHDSQLCRKNEIHSLIGDNTKLAKICNKIKQQSFKNTLRWMYFGE